MSKDLSTGSITAHLGKYGRLHLNFAATGALHAARPGKGCTGPNGQSRPLQVTAASGGLVLDRSFFRTVHIGRVKATATTSGKLKCKANTNGNGTPTTSTRSLSVDSGKLSALFAPRGNNATAQITVTSSTRPLVTHSLTLTGPASSFTNAADASSATVTSFGARLTGTGTYQASQSFQGGSSGAFTGSLVAHFDSIGAQNVSGTQAFLSVPGFNPPPMAAFGESTGNPGQITFDDESSDIGGTIVAWSWKFGDGSTSSQQNPTHAYASSGTYAVTLTVTDNNGHTGSVTKNVAATANHPPIAGFTWDNSNGGNEVDFADTS